MAFLPDLIPFFASYGSYHNNKVNKAIHIVCIPTIVFSLLGLLHHLTFHWSVLQKNPIFEINIQFFFILFLTIAYMIIDFPSGVTYRCIYIHFLYNFFVLIRLFRIFSILLLSGSTIIYIMKLLKTEQLINISRFSYSFKL